MKTFSQIGRELISGKRRLRFRRPQVGARPGVLVFSEDAADTTVQFICYGRDVHHVDPDNLEELLESDDHVTWIDVQGLGNPAEIQRIAQMAKISDLMLEDIVNVPQRTHARCVNDRLLIVTQMVRLADNGKIHREQLSVYRYRNLVVTFQEEKGDVFSPLRDRLRNGRGPLRTGNADFLAYSIIDTVIDAYYPALEDTADRLQVLEQYALNHPTPTLLPFLTEARHEAVALQRAIKPQKEMLATLIRDKTGLLPPDIRSYFEDTNDHALQVADVADTLREMSVNLLSLYMSSMANHTNEQMKVLTIMASIFIPLTFIAGIYGMNFEHMPELHMRWAYPASLISMLLIALGLLFYFYRKGWIHSNSKKVERNLKEHLSQIQNHKNHAGV